MAQEFRVGAQALVALSPGSGVVRLRPAGIPGGDATAHGPRREALVNMQPSRCVTRTRSNIRRRGQGQKALGLPVDSGSRFFPEIGSPQLALVLRPPTK